MIAFIHAGKRILELETMEYVPSVGESVEIIHEGKKLKGKVTEIIHKIKVDNYKDALVNMEVYFE